jgi:hypothetical protein
MRVDSDAFGVSEFSWTFRAGGCRHECAFFIELLGTMVIWI